MKSNVLDVLVDKIKLKRKKRRIKTLKSIRLTLESSIISSKLKNANNPTEYELYSRMLKEFGTKAANNFLILHDYYSLGRYEDLLLFIDETRRAFDIKEERDVQKILKINYLKYLVGTKTLSVIALDLNLTLKELKKIFKSDKFRKENTSIEKVSQLLKGKSKIQNTYSLV